MNARPSAAIGVTSLGATSSVLAQNGTMMNGGMWGTGWMGGYGGYWVPVLVVAVLVGLIVWVVKQKK
jgi:asparagine N-glycosylation enzyme membrane subunit Stt3